MASSQLQETGRWPARPKKLWRHPHPQLTHARLQTTKGTSPLNGRRRPSLKKNNHRQKIPVGIVAAQNTQGLTALQKRKSAINVARLATLAGRSKPSSASGGRDPGRSRSRGRGDEQPNETGVRSERVSTQLGGRSQSRSTHMLEVRCGRVAARRVRDDAAPTPLMDDVSIKPVTGTPFLFDVFPHTGFY